MSYLSKEDTLSLVNIKLTDKGREFLATGFKMDNIFDIVKFSLGDSEIDYSLSSEDILKQKIMEPINNPPDLKSKIYAYGVAPSGIATISLESLSITLSKFGSASNKVSTTWSPIDGEFNEEYTWTNLGPLNDYDFAISKSRDTKTAKISAFEITGSTTIKVMGVTSGEYALFSLTITN